MVIATNKQASHLRAQMEKRFKIISKKRQNKKKKLKNFQSKTYLEKRRKNNEAAKRSREKRRKQELHLEQRVMELKEENDNFIR